MSRSLVGILVGLVTLFSTLGSTVRAVPFVCRPHDNPGICEAVFGQGQELAIRSGVPFVWLRKAPSSSGAIVGTIAFSTLPTVTVAQFPSTYDGYQNWWLVAPLSNPSLKGWVEQDSLVDPINPDSAPTPQWTTPFMATIRSGLPFAWIRQDPYSSASVLATILPGNTFTVLNVSNESNHWWYIRATTAAGVKEGYLEQGSIVPAPATTGNGSAAKPACDPFTLSPGTFKPAQKNMPPDVDLPESYQVSPNSTITFQVTGLQNVVSVTFYLPGMDDMGWTNRMQPQVVSQPGSSAQVQLTVPSGGYTVVWVDALGTDGEAIQCGNRTVVSTFTFGS